MADMFGGAETPMTLEQFHHALTSARAGRVVSDTGASTEMDRLLIDVAVSTPGTHERVEAVKAARQLFQAERVLGSRP